MNNIIPAIMPKNYDELYSAIESVADLVSVVQIDIMDGQFVPDFSWPYASKIPKATEEHFLNMVAEKEGLPFWEKIDVELDLMVQDADVTFAEWIAIGPRRIILHIESLQNPDKTFQENQALRDIVEIGISLNNDTSNEAIEKYIDKVDFIQFMGISRIGFQGQEFDARVLEKIKYFHKKYPKLPISVDGAVNEDTLKSLKDAGVTRFVAGSAVFGRDNKSADVEYNIETLERI